MSKFKVKSNNQKVTNIPFRLNLNFGDKLLIVNELEDINPSTVINSLKEQKNLFIMIRDRSFDVIDYLYIVAGQSNSSGEN